MSIPIKSLDDRRFGELVEQGRALIPLYAPEWTCHNASDPGITLMELFAWLTELDVFRLNRVPDAHRRCFLGLLGAAAEPPRPARGVVEFRLRQAPDPTQPLGPELPATLELAAHDGQSSATLFQTTATVNVVSARLTTVLVREDGLLHDRTPLWARGETLPAFGALPAPGAELQLGFDAALPKGAWVSLHVEVAGEAASAAARERLVAEHGGVPAHDARTVWEYLVLDAGVPRWLALEVEDDTRSFTLAGRVRLRVTRDMALLPAGPNARAAYYLRCRYLSGGYDAPPEIARLATNAVEVLQLASASQGFPIAPGTLVEGTFAPGTSVSLRMRLVAGAIVELSRDTSGDAPRFRVAEYRAPTATQAGRLALELVLVGQGNAEPNQVFQLPTRPVAAGSLELFSLEDSGFRRWQQQTALLASSHDDADFVLDATLGKITLGDGDRGRALPDDALLLATYRSTRAEAGTEPTAEITAIADSAHNQALPVDVPSLRGAVTVRSLVAAAGGKAEETLTQALARAAEAREGAHRAVSLTDYETLALTTPGTRIARVAAVPNLYPGLGCIAAPGVVTVLVVPAMPGPRPTPSRGLLRAVARRLERRRVVGTRIEVVAPRYLEVGVRARVRAVVGADRAKLRLRLATALNAFLDPLGGGPEHRGWPFGRDVFRSEILQVLDETEGVSHVLALELIAGNCKPSCSNVCLQPTWLVAAGALEIEVV